MPELPKSKNGKWNYFICHSSPGVHGSLIVHMDSPIEDDGMLIELYDFLKAKGPEYRLTVISNVVPLSMP